MTTENDEALGSPLPIVTPEYERPAWGLAAVLLAATLALFALRLFTGKHWQDTFTAFFLAITLSATPYVLLGACVSAVVETFLPATLLLRVTNRLGIWSVPATVAVAPVFSICECGVVSMMRSLVRKGLPLRCALTYLLAAPIVNPVVWLSTYVAFQNLRYPMLRLLGGVVVSMGIGFAFSRVKPERAFRPGFLTEDPGADSCGCQDACCAADAPAPQREHASRRMRAWHTARDLARRSGSEFLEMMPYFLMGVFIASAMKTFLGDSVLSLAGQSRVLGPLTMMAMAFVLSLCSEADAFPAASFTTFSLPSHMAFLVLGPMLDIKLLLMYRTVFRKRFIATFALSIIAGVALYVALLEIFL